MPATPAREKIAVILVPGIFASSLYDPDGTTGWPVNHTGSLLVGHVVDSPSTQREIFRNGHRFGAIDPATLPPAGVDRVRGWQNVFFEGGYKDFLADCAAAGTRGDLPFDPIVHALAYNFTFPNAVTAERSIARETRAILERHSAEAKRFIFVTHSMGALAVRSALEANPDLRPNCVCVIHVAAPNAGAPESLMRFIRGSRDSRVVQFVFGNRGWKSITSGSAIATGLELFPFPMFRHQKSFGPVLFNLNGVPLINPDGSARLPLTDDDPFALASLMRTHFDGDVDLDLRFQDDSTARHSKPLRPTKDGGRWTTAHAHRTGILTDLQKAQADAKRFHNDVLRDYIFERTGALVLKGRDTVVGVRLGFDAVNRVNKAEEIRGDGDGTVPEKSQRHLVPTQVPLPTGWFDPVREISGVEHSQALAKEGADAGAFPKIYELLRHFHSVAPPAQ